ncbi:MAG TPA: hypothetical protein VG963_34310, partial [Polyangiaceae bacterium]|nr:hypothetical protein [Polyangiaceae bacterium]
MQMKKRAGLALRFLSWLTALVSLTLMSARASAATVPQVLTEQGRLVSSGGRTVDGTLSFRFALYDAATGGTALWTETQMVTLSDGVFAAQLGSVNPIPITVFDGNSRYLGVTVDTDAEMTPRQQVTTVPYALVAQNVIGDITPSSI